MLLELIGRRCRLGVLLSGFCQRSLAQIESRIEGDDVKPVGSSLNFQCRGRNDNLEEGEKCGIRTFEGARRISQMVSRTDRSSLALKAPQMEIR